MTTNQANNEIFMLNINQKILSIATGRLNPAVNADTLLIGTPTNILAYDVENNSDVFYKDVPDGANTIAVGTIGNKTVPLAVVGGNCSLQGFDYEGRDPFWTVTGDNVTSLIITDYSKDGKNELIVGSEDFEIRVFSEDEIITEITETEAVTALTPVQDGRFGYALANGTVGVYEKTTRWWRIKSKNQATCIHAYDLDGDGVKEMITGWSSGKLDARNDRSGEVIFKENIGSGVAGLVEGDYRMDGKMELIVCSTDGEVRGYLPAATDSRKNLMNVNIEQETLRELYTRKQNLLLELKNYSTNEKAANATTRRLVNEDEVGKIPAQTQLQTALAINMGSEGKQPHVEVTLSTSNSTIIKAVLIFAEGIFEGESFVVHPKELDSSISVPISPPRDLPVDLHIKVLVGYESSTSFHVFELTRQLPRFSMYSLFTEKSSSPRGSDDSGDETGPEMPAQPRGEVTIVVKERVQRITMWVNQNFLLTSDIEDAQNLDLKFVSLRDKGSLHIKMEQNGTIKIGSNSMELAGDIIHSLANFLGLEDLSSTANFPDVIEKVESLLNRAEELNSVRQKLSAAMADNSGLVRTMVVRGEDSRILRDMQSLKKWYGQLHAVNKDLISEYKIRCKNHEELMETLKDVNQIIQQSARLRIGKSKMIVVTECREAIKQKNPSQLIKVIQTGKP